MAKANITRTYGPIHFEDLDPHRFEDLVRELIYDYKDWQTIEATGRSGNDEGFDIRAYERVSKTVQSEIEDNDDKDEIHPMDGNLWMIQGKREKEIGPKRVKEILSDIDPQNPPYGYILAASANFSKDSYDAFREELRKKGVMEFYLWGKAELEDMLYLPKNDRILFTFFGISLVSKRRSRSTEIRQVVNNKNKLYRIFGEHVNHKSVLARDSKDSKYPYAGKYNDFKDRPRWREYFVTEYHPLGIIVEVKKYFGYIDTEKQEFDFSVAVNVIFRQSDSQEDKDKQSKDRERVEDFWECLPHRNRSMYILNGMIRYDNILVIDDTGDDWHKFPHLYVDFDAVKGPFSGYFDYIEYGAMFKELKKYKRIEIFPKSFPAPKIGKIHKTRGITLDDNSFRTLKGSSDDFFTLYDLDGRYGYLKQRDVVPVENVVEKNSYKYYLKITHVESLRVEDYLKESPHLEWNIQQQVGKKPNPKETINIYECKRSYDFNFDPKKMP